jgi:hypothetical protein
VRRGGQHLERQVMRDLQKKAATGKKLLVRDLAASTGNE